MAIFEITQAGLKPVAETRFDAEGLRERADIQRLVRENINILEDGLMVVAEEFGEWMDSSRRIDLLCLDTDANLVVVELKRTIDGGHMELQAIRYAAMVSAMTFDQLIDVHARFLNRGSPNIEGARAAILDFLGWATPDEERFGEDVRIILASADFGKELTTAVVWLNDRGLDIRCVRLKPYKIADGRILLDVQQLIPLPEVAEFQTQIGIKKQAERSQSNNRHEARLKWWAALLEYARTQTPLHAGRSPTRDTWISGSGGRAGFAMIYTTRETEAQVQVWIGLGAGRDAENKRAFHALKAHQAQIEQAFGAPLDWLEMPGRSGCRICKVYPGGYRSPVEEWPELHRTLVAAMVRLHGAFADTIRTLQF